MTAISQRNAGVGVIWILIGGLLSVKGVILLSPVIPYYDVSCRQLMIAGQESTNVCSSSSIVLALSASSLLVGIAVMALGAIKHSRSRAKFSAHPISTWNELGAKRALINEIWFQDGV